MMFSNYDLGTRDRLKMSKLLIINFEPTVVETEQHKSKKERPDAPRAGGTGDKLYMSKLFS